LPPPGVERAARQVQKVFEGEQMRVLAKSAKLEPQHLGSEYSNERHLWWQQAKVGDKIVLGFDLVAGGRYTIVGHFVKAMDYGIHRLSINGKSMGEPIDFYDPGVVPSGEMVVGTADLRQGENRLGIECTGTNPEADPKYYMFGLDYLRIEPGK
jgi:hypothetical protein